MIDADTGDHGYVLLHDIRRIEPPAKPDFQDRELDTIAKVQKRHSRDQFEVCRRI